MLLGLLWVTGVTGLRPRAGAVPADGAGLGLLGLPGPRAVAMELVLLAPFMKLAHAVYRPVALFFVALATGEGKRTGNRWRISAQPGPSHPTHRPAADRSPAQGDRDDTDAAAGGPRAPRAAPRSTSTGCPRSPTGFLTGDAGGRSGPTSTSCATFLTGPLLPHVEAAEQTLYPELERMYQNRHSMAPMRREHDEVRRLADDFIEPDRAGRGRRSRAWADARAAARHLPALRPAQDPPRRGGGLPADRRPRRGRRRRRGARRRARSPRFRRCLNRRLGLRSPAERARDAHPRGAVAQNRRRSARAYMLRRTYERSAPA